MKREISLIGMMTVLAACGSTSPAESVFNDVMDAMNHKDTDKIIGYFCDSTLQQDGVDIEMIKGLLEASLKDRDGEGTYKISGTEEKENSTLINYEYTENGETGKDSLEIFHASSKNNSNYCVGM